MSVGYLPVVSFLHHLPLVGLTFLVVLLASGNLGRGFGVPLLVWHENPVKRLAAACALTLLTSELAMVAFLLDPDVVARGPNAPSPEAFVVQILGLAAVGTVAGLLLNVRGARRDERRLYWLRGSWWFLAGVTFGLGGTEGILLLSHSSLLKPVTAFLTWILRWAGLAGVDLRPAPELHDLAGALTVVLGLVFVFVFVFGRLDRRAEWVTPIISVCTLLGLVGSAYGFSAKWAPSQVPLAFLVLAGFAVVLWIAGVPSRSRTPSSAPAVK